MLTSNTQNTVTKGVRQESNLRGVDLNLLTVFDAVMQEQNITRAAQNLNMSQPAVSNAVARLKVMFQDELFMRQGRGIAPTLRARQLFGPVRQALQLIKNELPGASFDPVTSTRNFSVAICTPNDVRFAPRLMRDVAAQAPNVTLKLDSLAGNTLEEKLKYQDIDFVIDYAKFEKEGFVSTEIFSDELVVVCSKNHPRLGGVSSMNLEQFQNEKHARLSRVNGMVSFNELIYKNLDCETAYQGATLGNLIAVAAQSELICAVPSWITKYFPDSLGIQTIPYPKAEKQVKAYLTWHESIQKDGAHTWMRDQLMAICGEVASEEATGF
ncbi:transcriptional regulator LeuO [Vibrio ishigakensis]|uniref:transcriptional regulator LeuO n=1 Tax=Vibrio ishigakensis TaxID=1481914 RepID=UPI0021C29BA5|nr:transcriptional regulator LeuO [Vibrio ishigakensis]